jgi:holo-[acyl-carrier protein] synthase
MSASGHRVIGVGTDIIETRRFIRIAREAPSGVASRIFTPGELEGAVGRGERCASQHLASRFAAKEAVMKSLGCGMNRIEFIDIELVHDGVGRPVAVLRGTAKAYAEELSVADVMVSLSHTEHYACAFAVALGGSARDPD